MNTSIIQSQLELRLSNSSFCPSARARRRTNARRWFERMRQIVDNAVEWGAPAPARPVQIGFSDFLGTATVQRTFSE